ncbi:MAG TPA: SRPBCC family protein [Armatimonadota bacterium]|nr:SRPBCC family protein [Armatimonadota bacterium]
MPRIELHTRINAPIERCFDLARDVGAHCETAAFTRERVLPPGRTAGLLELGDEVIFEAVHLGVRRRLRARITEMERPTRFVDEMVEGDFQRLRHVHEFRREGDVTVMRDVIEWTSPLGLLGRLADRLFVERHLRWFLATKQAKLEGLAEEGQEPA